MGQRGGGGGGGEFTHPCVPQQINRIIHVMFELFFVHEYIRASKDSAHRAWGGGARTIHMVRSLSYLPPGNK